MAKKRKGKENVKRSKAAKSDGFASVLVFTKSGLISSHLNRLRPHAKQANTQTHMQSPLKERAGARVHLSTVTS